MAAGEIKDPRRIIVKSLTLGMATVLGLYIFINLAYFYVLPFAEVASASSLAHSHALPVATQAAQAIFGSRSVPVLSIAFTVSALGAMNGSILTGARVPYAMANDGMFISALGRLSKKNAVPLISVIAQGTVASVLAFSGSFDQLTDAVVFSSWIFYALCTAAIFIFRHRGLHATFRVPGYPVVPAIFIVLSAALLIQTISDSPKASLQGLAMIITGVPVYYFFRRTRAK
jgi:APA family basic amino acid/polyamine antiporter